MSSNRFKFRRNGRFLHTHLQHLSYRSEPIHVENVSGFLVGFTVLAVLHPCCVIGIPEPGLGVFFKGRFTNCRFFYNEQQPLPMKFTCAAWCQCMLLYEGEDGSLRRYVEVAEDGSGTFTVTITECQEQDEGGSLTEDSTGYIFHLDDGGELHTYREFSCDVTDHELADARHFGGPRSKKKWSTALLLAVLTNPVAI